MGVKWEWEEQERGKWEDFLVMWTVVESPRFVELGSELPQIRMYLKQNDLRMNSSKMVFSHK